MKRVIVLGLTLAATLAAADPSLEKIDLFEAGVGGYYHYRIPAIVSTTEGTLLAFAEARKNARGDWGPIDILMRRSTDGGRTWDEPRPVAEVEGEIQQNPVALEQGLARPGEVTYNNPAPIVDRETGAIHFLFCVEYARAYYIRSDDDGRSWTEPVDVTATFDRFRPEYDWRVVATGPGHGIQLRSGRLLVPVWLSDGTGGHAHRPSVVATVYSDDHGRTWRRGEILARHPFLENPSETVAVELADGRVMANIRNELPAHLRAVAYSPDGAADWTVPLLHPQLVEPICMGSIARHGEHLLFVNPRSREPRDPARPEGNFKRQNVSIHLSEDEGRTWPVVRSIEPGMSGYSDIAVGADGWIYVFYERGSPTNVDTTTGRLTVARLNLAWITDGGGATQ